MSKLNKSIELFIQTIARMNFDGEEMGSGQDDYTMENDDAVTTLSELIAEARTINAAIKAEKIALANESLKEIITDCENDPLLLDYLRPQLEILLSTLSDDENNSPGF